MKKKFAKVIGSAMVATLMLGGVTPTYATTVELTEINVIQEYNQELDYAIEEMRIVVDYLDNKDLTNLEDLEYMLAFTTAAVERVRPMENTGHVAWINETADDVRVAVDTARVLVQHMQNIESIFNGNYAIEDKGEQLGNLQTGIAYVEENYFVNQTTVESVHEFIEEYEIKLEVEYAKEEMKIAKEYLDTADFTNSDNREATLIFANTALERVRNMEVTQDIQGIFDGIEEVRVDIDQADWLNEHIARVKNIFDSSNNHPVENKKIELDYLNEALSYAVHEERILNDITLHSVNDILHEYWNLYNEEITK